MLISGMLAVGNVGSALAAERQDAEAVVERLLAAPRIETAPGFAASVLVAPGALYDPLWPHPQNGAVWLNNDGGEEGKKGSRILAIDETGALSVLVALGRLLPATGFDVAPQGFGAHGGELFIADAGDLEIPVPMTQQLAADGVLYRAGGDGTLHPVATGLVNPMGVAFVGTTLWGTDINGDFIAGKRELPDGFVLRFTPERAR